MLINRKSTKELNICQEKKKKRECYDEKTLVHIRKKRRKLHAATEEK